MNKGDTFSGCQSPGKTLINSAHPQDSPFLGKSRLGLVNPSSPAEDGIDCEDVSPFPLVALLLDGHAARRCL